MALRHVDVESFFTSSPSDAVTINKNGAYCLTSPQPHMCCATLEKSADAPL
jgi:hypothetical protein